MSNTDKDTIIRRVQDLQRIFTEKELNEYPVNIWYSRLIKKIKKDVFITAEEATDELPPISEFFHRENISIRRDR